ncbi:MAG: aminopeptidase [Firmicutes bacterium]|nr:aminopeptidase [Bacillota bacterium]
MNSLKLGVEQVLYKCMGMQVEEDLLIVSDTETESLGDLFYDVAISGGLHAESIKYPALPMDGMEPPKEVAEALLKCDVAILVTSKSLTHTRARHAASDKGVRIASLPGFTEAMLGAPMMVDYDEMAALSKKIAEMLTKAETARVVTPFGTDFTMSLKGRVAEDDNGLYNETGAFGNLPAGEAYVAPLEGTANGMLVYDASMGGIGLLSEPIRVTVENGEAVKVEGGKEADALNAMLEKAGRSGRNIAELGIGTNRGASLNGSVLEDEKVLMGLEIRREDIMDILEDFGEIPKSLYERIMLEDEMCILKKMLKAAAKADSLEQFEELISNL